MASQYDGDDDGSLIEDDTINEFYENLNNNEVYESLAEEEEGIVKSSSPLVYAKTSSLRYYPILNSAEKIIRYQNQQQQQQKSSKQLQLYHQQNHQKQQQQQQSQYRSLSSSSSTSSIGGGVNEVGAILRNRLRSIPLKTKKFSNSIISSKKYQQKFIENNFIGRNFEYILPIKRSRKLEANRNENNNLRFKTDTSISGFKNHTSTNYDQKQFQQEQSKTQPKDTKNKRLFETTSQQQQQQQQQKHHQNNQNQLHSHQTRSIIDGSSNLPHQQQQQQHQHHHQKASGDEVINSGRSGISFDRVEVSWLEPTLPLTTVFAISIFGIVILGIVIIFWLKNLLFHRNKTRKQDHRIHEINKENRNNNNCHVYRTEGQNFIKEKSKVMDDDSKTYQNFDNDSPHLNQKYQNKEEPKSKNDKRKHFDDYDDKHDHHYSQHFYQNDSDNVEVVDNKIIDELHSNFDGLTIEKTPKNDVLLVDKKSSPIVLDQNNECGSRRQHFIFTNTASSATLTDLPPITLTTSIFSNTTVNQSSTGIIPLAAIPVPVPVPLPIPIPVPIPIAQHQQIFQQSHKLEKSYRHHQQDQQQFQELNNSKKSVRPLLIKSSSVTTPVSLSTALSTAQNNRSRRFSLCERRSYSPQTTSNICQQHHQKSQSVSRLSRRECFDNDLVDQNHQTVDCISTTATTINQKCFDGQNSRNDDKENEIPTGGEVYSPKMKLSEQVLAQQNSPRSFNDSPATSSSTTVTRFTFSPKQILTNSENNNYSSNNLNTGNSPPIPQQSSLIGGQQHQPSPLLNSAVYKHGNYFKFPEVDCLTPDKVQQTTSTVQQQQPQYQKLHQNHPPIVRLHQNSFESLQSSDDSVAATSSSTSSSPQIKNKPSKLSTPPIVTQATRRARLKSISLDSDGARLVEDNLGIPVEEIIERANQSPTLADDCFVFQDTISNQASGDVKYDVEVHHEKDTSTILPLNNQKITESQEIDTVDGVNDDNNHQHKFNIKNKNHLTITIGPEILKDDDTLDQDISNASGDSVKIIPHLQTPKTPTLTQTKQKAISLDSSDSNIIYCLPSSSNIGGVSQQNRASNSTKTSLLQISSVSVPTTPKRQQLLLSSSSMGGMGRKLQSTKGSKTRLLNTSSKFGLSKSSTSTPSTSFDHDCALQKPQGFIKKLRSFNENTLDDGFYNDEQFYLDSEGELLLLDKRQNHPPRSREFSSDLEDENYISGQNFTGSNSSLLLGANLQNQKCTTSLSLSNNNLKTLPEVMTISDFSTDTQKIQHTDDDKKTLVKSITSPGSNNTTLQGGIIGVVQKTPRNSILQRRGSNHSLTLNLNGSLGNLTKSLSVSNYSLGSTNLQGSQCNLSGSSHNLSHHQQQQQITGSLISNSQIGVPQCSYVGGPSGLATNMCTTGGNKKNLLQRRGSNTSLTLNIKGSSCISLNRFNSHSSLNISSMQQQSHPHQLQHQQAQLQAQQIGTLGGGGVPSGSCTKKGLLERRNSNASLTLNIQNRALSVSNCNLRGSACSLSSVNTNLMDYDSTIHAEHHNEQETQQQFDLPYSNSVKHRKFLSSENLNSITQCSKLNQTHVRNSTKTCFGSVSDLKPHQLVQQQKVQPQSMQKCGRDISVINSIGGNDTTKQLITTFGESNLCSCTGVRNITTKPLSPQSTSEDFKMYLANIQLLQNATNILDDEHLRKLSYIFEKSYNMTTTTTITQTAPQNDTNLEIRATSITATTQATATATATNDDQCINDDIIDITINFEAPNDDEQKLLLRNLHQEFWDLPTNYQEKPLVFGSQAKNRYKTILPNEHSRVILDCEPGFVQEPYINANYIKGPDYTQNSYIATQGPMSNTIYEYWLMIYQNVEKFHSKISENSINKTLSDENQDNRNINNLKQLENDDNDDDDTSNNCQNIIKKSSSNECNINSNSSNITLILKQQKTPTAGTISIRNSFAPGISNNSNRNINNYNTMEFNSGKFNQKIVMLTNFVENNRQKCSIYFPIDAGKIILITNTNEKIDCGDLIKFYENYFNNTETDDYIENFSNNDAIKLYEIHINDNVDIRQKLPKSNYFIIKNCGIIKKNGYSIRKLHCIYCQIIDNNHHQYYQFLCYHYWFPDWPDHRSPSDIDVLLDMSLHLLDNKCENEFNNNDDDDDDNDENIKINNEIIPKIGGNIDNQPIPIIHCSAGIGRTGCLAAILNGLRQMRTSLIQYNDDILIRKNNINVDVLGIVCNLRLQRGGMVQNSEQYELIHRALCLYLKRLDMEKFGISIDSMNDYNESINKKITTG